MSANVGTMENGSTVADVSKHPKGLYVLFGTEMWERFSFYSMLALFTLYLRDPAEGFGWTATQATSLYANYLMFVYASPLIGGLIADKITGYRKDVMIGGVFFMAGHGLLSIPALRATQTYSSWIHGAARSGSSHMSHRPTLSQAGREMAAGSISRRNEAETGKCGRCPQ